MPSVIKSGDLNFLESLWACYGTPRSIVLWSVAYPGIFFGGGEGGLTNSVEDREKGDLGVVAP